jgi:hypothetical protein
MKDWQHYLILVIVLSIGLGLFLFFSYNRQIQALIVIMMAGAYLLWGILHHAFRREFYWRIIAEYLAVALVTTIVVIFLLLRA